MPKKIVFQLGGKPLSLQWLRGGNIKAAQRVLDKTPPGEVMTSEGAAERIGVSLDRFQHGLAAQLRSGGYGLKAAGRAYYGSRITIAALKRELEG